MSPDLLPMSMNFSFGNKESDMGLDMGSVEGEGQQTWFLA